ncbi:hypothetical protein IO90_16975 [Chryseobacterium sp. FH1]|nr:hypothetical protein IO90_16975 [Chryseobacterium sp. FH1]
MKFGIININTLFVVLIILICSSILSYISIFKGLIYGDLILIAKFFLALIILINLFIIAFIIFRFRLIIITNRDIFILHPFRFLIIKTKVDRIKKLNWSSYVDSKAIYYRQFTFKTESNQSIILCDKEFENLDYIVQSLSQNTLANKKNYQLNFERAKSNKTTQFYNLVFTIFLICSLVFVTIKMENWNNNNLFSIGLFLMFTIIMFYFNLKKYLTYKKTLRLRSV